MKRNLLFAGYAFKSLSLYAVLQLGAMNVAAQCGFGAGLGCANTDYDNFGYRSNSNAGTIEYDNFISTFHSTIVRDTEGKLQIWGQNTGISGAALVHLTAKTEINSTNFPGLTGIPIKAAMGSNSITGNQVIVLTTTGLHTWGNAGTVLSNNAGLSSQSTVKKIVANSGNNINSYGLPGTVSPADVKMMFATYQTLAIVTCNGDAYVLSQNANMRGDGAATSALTWYQVKTNAAGNPNLGGVVALRGNATTLMALTSNNKIYTWGTQTLLGTENTAATSSRAYAEEMSLPEAGNVKMIGATTRAAGTNATTYYVLFTNGHLWAMGNNQNRQLGDWGTTASPSSASRRWVQPLYPQSGSNSDNSATVSGAAMEDIVWISPGEHDNQNAAINVINSNGRLWNFGTNAGIMLGRTPASTSTSSNINPLNPGQPLATVSPNTPTVNNNFDPLSSMVLGVETGGHTTMIATQCEQNFGYVGHATNGSAGNSTNTNYETYSYATAMVNICGAEGAPEVALGPVTILGGSGKVCASQAVELEGTPAGGILSIVSGPATLSGNTLSFTAGTGTVTVRYKVTTTCGVLTTDKVIEIEPCTIYNVSGAVWIDNNANAITNTGENGTNGATANNSGLWANLVNSSGLVVASVPVNADGTYKLPTTANGTYSVEITNIQVGKGVAVPAAARVLPEGWSYTGNNKNGSPCIIPACSAPAVIPAVVVNGTDVGGNNFGIKGIYTVSGNVYHDGNGLNDLTPAVAGPGIYGTNSAYEVQHQPQLYISVLDADGTVIHYVPVSNNGSYTLDIPLKVNATLQLTTTVPVVGSSAAAPSLPSGWVYAGEDFGTGNGSGNGVNNGGGTGNNAPATRYDGKIALSFPAGTTNISNVNFGIQEVPVADSKQYMVSNADFSNDSPGGAYPAVPGFKWIAMSSGELVEKNNSTNGSLSGTDAEDCATGNCNGNAGGISSSFTIGTINSNTRLYYDFGVANGGIREVLANTVIGEFDITKMMIYGQAGQGTSGNELGFTYSMKDKAGFSSPLVRYEIASTDVLPVTLVGFNVIKSGDMAELNWITAREQNSKGFTVERSGDARKWSEIGFVRSKSAHGNSAGKLMYDYQDSKPLAGINYYRLKLVDLEGKYIIGPVRSLQFKEFSDIHIYPNPVSKTVTIEGLKGSERIHVYNIAGKLVYRSNVQSNRISISLETWSAGLYNISIVGPDGKVSSYTIVKE